MTTENRDRGSEFVAGFELTAEEYQLICQHSKLLILPKSIVTTFNGEVIPYRRPAGGFEETLPMPLADKEGVMRNMERKTRANLYETLPGEVAMIYEMEIPIVELGDDKSHVNVMQFPVRGRPTRIRVLERCGQMRRLKVAFDVGERRSRCPPTVTTSTRLTCGVFVLVC